MVTILKQSGNPVDDTEAEKYSKEWKEGFNQYNINLSVDLPKSIKGWKALLTKHKAGIMIDEDAKTGKLMLVILDLGL